MSLPKAVVIATAALVAIFLAAPWVATGYGAYLDWQWCATHEFHQHTWNTNVHDCTPVEDTR